MPVFRESRRNAKRRTGRDREPQGGKYEYAGGRDTDAGKEEKEEEEGVVAVKERTTQPPTNTVAITSITRTAGVSRDPPGV